MRSLFLSLSVLLLLVSTGNATPAHKKALSAHFGPFLIGKLNDCRTCHTTPASIDGGETEKPRNAFGTRLEEVREKLRTEGKKTDIVSRIEAIAEEDTDRDGVPNFVEILLGHAPGDAKDTPTPATLATLPAKQKEFQRYLTGYRWKPLEVVTRPAVPEVRNAAWVRNPIDRFIAAEHQERGLTPRPEADRDTLLRRVYLDLTGLSPTREELLAFRKDQSPDAFEKVVDQLLASPQYGERWGRHWMDVWRYADWAGFGAEVRDSQPHVWHWRDWIIESLNRDTPYDRMVQEMLAGDELAPEDENTLRATGYLVRNYKRYGRERWMQDTVDHTFQAFQATTIGCSRCHDHMYDPLLQKEYYQVRAIFEPHNLRTDRRPGQPDTKLDGLVRVYDADAAAKTFLFIRGDDRTPEKTPLSPGVPAALGGKFANPEAIKLPPKGFIPDRREFVLKELIETTQKSLELTKTQEANARRNRWLAHLIVPTVANPLPAVSRLLLQPKWEFEVLDSQFARQRLAETIEKYGLLQQIEALEDAGKTSSPEWTKLAKEIVTSERRLELVRATQVLEALSHGIRTIDPKKKQIPLAQEIEEARKVLQTAESAQIPPPTTNYTKRPATSYPPTSTGRRLSFARWLTARENPLTARVAMNHIWLRHFGTAIVPSVFDFGKNGRPASHPALLDWLAAELMDNQWSMKKMHRLIVTSATWRQASTPDEANRKIDPDNLFYWRMTPHRLEAEVVRDLVFHVAGKLDLAKGGADIPHAQGLTNPRRSIYFQHAAEKQMEFLKLFDSASVNECYQRRESVVPQQALALFNSDLAIRHARLLARKLVSRTGDDSSAFIEAAFESVLSRSPSSAEKTECSEFIKEQTEFLRKNNPTPAKSATPDLTGLAPHPDTKIRACENLVHVLLNHHDFVTLR